VEWISEREVVLLHADDVREVRPETELQREGDRHARLVAKDDVVLKPPADEPVARDGEGVLRKAVGGRVS